MLKSAAPRLAFIAAAGTLCLSGAVSAAPLVSHDALYDIRLAHSERSSSLGQARGTMAYSFADACDGWVVENRSMLTFYYVEGRVMETSWTFSSWEAKDGLSYRFMVQQTRDGELVEEIAGRATLQPDGSGGIAHLTAPEERDLPLPPGTLFPTSHLKLLAKAAEEGRHFVQRPLFDGASLDNPFAVNAVIGNAGEKKPLSAQGGDAMEPMALWPVALAYYPVQSGEAEPEFEMSLRYRLDGIANFVRTDYGDFTLDTTLNRITPHAAPSC